MFRLFSGATSFNQDIGSWDTSKTNNMVYIFSNATSFNQDINSWDINLIDNMTGMTGHSTLSDKVAKSSSAYLMIRPEFMRLVTPEQACDVTMDVVVSETFNRGSTTQIKATSVQSEQLITMEIQGRLDSRVKIGSTISVGWKDSDTHLFDRQPNEVQSAA